MKLDNTAVCWGTLPEDEEFEFPDTSASSQYIDIAPEEHWLWWIDMEGNLHHDGVSATHCDPANEITCVTFIFCFKGGLFLLPES